MQALLRARGYDLADEHRCLLVSMEDCTPEQLPAGHDPLPIEWPKRNLVNILPGSCLKLKCVHTCVCVPLRAPAQLCAWVSVPCSRGLAWAQGTCPWLHVVSLRVVEADCTASATHPPTHIPTLPHVACPALPACLQAAADRARGRAAHRGQPADPPGSSHPLHPRLPPQFCAGGAGAVSTC